MTRKKKNPPIFDTGVWAVGGGMLSILGAPHLVIRTHLYVQSSNLESKGIHQSGVGVNHGVAISVGLSYMWRKSKVIGNVYVKVNRLTIG